VLQQPARQLVRLLAVQATAAQLPVRLVHGGSDRVEILPVVVAAVPDTSAREDLAENALAPGEGRHHAAIPPALILGERGIDLRQAHHPHEPAAVRRTPMRLGWAWFSLRPAAHGMPAAASRIIASPRSARAAATR
jgi:hypothetical protein